MATKIHCDNPSCRSEVEDDKRHGWFVIEEYLDFVSYVVHEGGPWHFCSVECIEQWAASKRNQ